ncbi:MAG: hypothetical protein IPH85_03040 [Ignavibacteria bacterium]|nr:hypothetical protein [Ignavibacteria bacterium]MBP6510281.1 hypothetical protein [Candidatus Kapabacteria bacterium]MBK7032799.1 hypothetical protein [Ignavibacteria bacterium]MBK7184892.1 hypothetical protein [Ignavibacteria bacterium]MBK7577195.1 hypothetical protein [Ignavibacteria bacterium]
MKSRHLSGIAATAVTIALAIVADPVSPSDALLAAITLSFVANEVYQGLTHNAFSLTRLIRFSPLSIVFGIVAFITMTWQTDITKASTAQVDRVAQGFGGNEWSYHEPRRTYGMFENSGEMREEYANLFAARESELEPTEPSQTLAALIDLDRKTFGIVLDRSTKWLNSAREFESLEDSVARLYEGFTERVDTYVGMLPESFASMQNEARKRNHSESELSFFETRFLELEPTYDSVFVAIHTESYNLKEWVAEYGVLESRLAYWSPTNDPFEDERRTSSILQRTAARKEAFRCIRIINACRHAILSYRLTWLNTSKVLP